MTLQTPVQDEYTDLPAICSECGEDRETAELASVCCTWQSPFFDDDSHLNEDHAQRRNGPEGGR